LSRDEKKRVEVIERVLSGSMSNEEAAASLGVTERQLIPIYTKLLSMGLEWNGLRRAKTAAASFNSIIY
jgi:hypothetical protein